MNERHLFKAKRTDNGEWIIGFYHWTNWRNPQTLDIVDVTHSILPINCQDSYYVDPSTICQCTGLRDKNGKLIWENDIIKCKCGIAVVVWDKSECRIKWVKDKIWRKDLHFWVNDENEYGVEVIGSAIDNPELLEVGE